MKRLLRLILGGLLLVLTILATVYHELLVYGLSQARGQFTIIWNAKPVAYYMEDPLFPDSLKSKLHFIEEVRRFAIDSLALENTKNYTTLYDQQGKDLMWVVTASKRYALEEKEWHFPVVGKVPYKGYFVESKARKLAQQLTEQGWDADIKVPGGWSTLGWFKDPILSKMLLRSEGDLASLIIHEMVHSTIFVKDSIEFNENLASFIGDLGAFHFLKARYGKHSQQYEQYLREELDYNRFVNHMLMGADSLQVLYDSYKEDYSEELRQKLKQEMIVRIVESMDTLSLSYKFIPSVIFKDKKPNNAYFMSFIRYRSRLHNFENEFNIQFKGDIRAMINYYKAEYPFL